MPSSREVDYDALEASTNIGDITNDTYNQYILRSLRDGDGELSRLLICEGSYEDGEYHPESSEELGWLGHFAKNSVHLEEFGVCERDAFNNCSQQSIDKFFEAIGKCNRIRKLEFLLLNDLIEIMHKLHPAIKNNSITHWSSDECYLGEMAANNIFNAFRDDMKGLEELRINCHGEYGHDLNDDIMAGCIPSLAACPGMRKLHLISLGLSINSGGALSAVLPQMTALNELNLGGNLIGNDGVEVLIRGLADCNHLHSLRLYDNRIDDDGLEMLVQGLPVIIDTLDLTKNEITLARQLPLLRFKVLDLLFNDLSPDSPRVIAASLTNPECHLEELSFHAYNIGDEGAAILASGLRNNQRLTKLAILATRNAITETGWNEFLPILCDATSINATHGSNHTLQSLGFYPYVNYVPRDVRTMLELNHRKDKNLVAARKILQTHHHLDMRPLFEWKLIMLPYVVAWLERFAASQLDLKLSSIYEFARSMPMEVVDGVAGEKKGKKRTRDN
ncbi:hypothetical protein THAOC_35718 [Thalassiosira oceanica]|uniref:Uncharacterized protein n=1 Tax=Thalassiosira oceanica TaxID=159749 RepID=K0RGJ2_THAOC|nr:hypothetical protein THAOC_35718 [Thalassiosira oceanica]|eukprot:EJK45657.1 hypothetical protein THAOC_35718 [Thalassiosira oceanica]